MGTSKSYGGGGGKTPLLPDWAQGDEPLLPNDDLLPADGDIPPEEPLPTVAPPDQESPGDGDSVPPPNLPVDPVIPVQSPPFKPPIGIWNQAKSAMRNYTAAGGRDNLRRAGRNYVRTRGGAGRATRNSSGGRAATSGVVGFLSGVATRGIRDTLRAIGLDNLLGRPVESVLAAIVNFIAPDGASLDDVVARKTVSAVLDAVFQRYEVEDGGVERLNNMDAAGVEEALRMSIAEFIFQRWMLEFGKRIEEYAINAREAYKLEREAKAYVYEATKLDLQGKDVLRTDWNLPENQRLIDNIFEEAYGFLEGAE